MAELRVQVSGRQIFFRDWRIFPKENFHVIFSVFREHQEAALALPHSSACCCIKMNWQKKRSLLPKPRRNTCERIFLLIPSLICWDLISFVIFYLFSIILSRIVRRHWPIRLKKLPAIPASCTIVLLRPCRLSSRKKANHIHCLSSVSIPPACRTPARL